MPMTTTAATAALSTVTCSVATAALSVITTSASSVTATIAPVSTDAIFTAAAGSADLNRCDRDFVAGRAATPLLHRRAGLSLVTGQSNIGQFEAKCVMAVKRGSNANAFFVMN